MRRGVITTAFCITTGFTLAVSQNLRVATINCWSGLDYRAKITMGEYEPDSTRAQRFRILVDELKKESPDVIALQEANPVQVVACRLAEELGYDYVYQRTNGGIKIGTVGFPTNLNEGLVLLAKKSLRLRHIGVWDLSPGFGAFGNFLSFHFTDQNVALVCAIDFAGNEVVLINTHLSSTVPNNSASRSRLLSLLKERGATEQQQEEAFRSFQDDAVLRVEEVTEILERTADMSKSVPFILMGDFNATPDSPEIRMMTESEGFIDAAAVGADEATWDAEHNRNVQYSLRPVPGDEVLDFGGPLAVWYDSLSRRIDYVFLSPAFRSEDVRTVHRILDRPKDGLYASDHYGVMAEIAFPNDRLPERGQIRKPEPELEFLPILTYDTDVGFGYGGKGFFLNYLDLSESFDCILFNSTKGERWYRLVFSVPDFELRQGKKYPFSFDLIVDYDKYLKNNFFGIGGGTHSSQREVYTKEPLEVQAVMSRGFSERFVGQIGVRFKTVRNLNYDTTRLFAATLPAINHGRSSGLTLFSSFRYDSRNSFINPSSGNVAQLDLEAGSSEIAGDYSVMSANLTLQTYHILFYPKTVLAARLMGQAIGGSNLPIHTYASLGGNRTLRGFPQDRFLDRVALVSNVELRFPIIWRFNGIAFFDAGRLWGRVGQVNIFGRGWRTNTGVGLRFLMDTFVVRADLGLSDEGSGFYFNFGHIF